MKDWRRSRTPGNVERSLARLRLTGYYFGASKETMKMFCRVRRVDWRSLGWGSLGCRSLACLTLSLAVWIFPATSAAQTAAGLPSETPAKVEPVTESFDYVKRDVMIPMRDGVKLHTVILVPKGATNAPILLTRTPYTASDQTGYAQSSHLGPVLNGYDNAVDVIVEGGYIRVVQDVRGKYGSEGDYVMNRPLRGPLNPTAVDHATDTYDTIDWLVKNVPETNGKVGILGISYDGFLPLMALVNPHPALKVSVPMNPMVDGWMGDDWFHNGAFREQNMPYIYDQESTRDKVTNMVDRSLRRLRPSTWRRDRRVNWGAVMGWSRWDSGARSSSIPRTMPGGSSKRWTRFWRRSH